ncbi:MAG: hypothetical protein ABEK50_16365 [bacterium]
MEIAEYTWSDICRELWKGQSYGRSYMNAIVKNLNIEGPVIDVGAGGYGSTGYHYLMKELQDLEHITLDIDESKDPTYCIDLESEQIPDDISPRTALSFNFFEQIYHYQDISDKIFDSLVPGGIFYGWVPFLHRVHRNPSDYFRYTDEAIEAFLSNSGFEDITIEPAGNGAIMACLNQIDFVVPRYVAPVLYLISKPVDWILSRPSGGKYRNESDYPLGYFWCARKQGRTAGDGD